MIHSLNTLGKSLCRFNGTIHFNQIFIHLIEMLIDELVDNLRRQVDPDVEDSVLTLPLEGFKQIFLNIRHDGMGPSKVEMVPLTIRLVASDTLLANRSISQQMIDELDGEYFDLMIFFKSTHIDVVTLSYIQKDTVDKE